MLLLKEELMRNTFNVSRVAVYDYVRTIPRIFRKTAYFMRFIKYIDIILRFIHSACGKS